MISLRLILLAALCAAAACGGGPDPAATFDDAIRALPLARLEPAVRDQFEAAVAAAGEGGAEELGRLGMLCQCYGFPEQAESWYRQALAASGDVPRWSHALGLALIERGRSDEAATAFAAVLRARPDDRAARLRLAELDLERGRARAALDHFEAVASAGGANEVHGLAGAGRALVRLGDPDRARSRFEAALERSPEYAPARYALATLLRDEGRLDESARHFQRAQADRGLAPPIDDPLAREIDGLATGATTVLQRGMDLRARAESAADYEAAADLFEQAVRLDPRLAAAHAELGAARLALGDVPGAEASLREALRLDPASGNARYNLAWIAHRQGRPAEALDGFRAAAALRPADFDVMLALGVAALGAGEIAEGVSALQQAIEARPTDPRPYRHLDTHYSESGREAEAIAILRAGRRASAHDASLMMRLAWHLATAPSASLRDPVSALELARAVASATDHPRALDTLAAALAANGQFGEAAEIARRAVAGAQARGDGALAREIHSRVLRYEGKRP